MEYPNAKQSKELKSEKWLYDCTCALPTPFRGPTQIDTFSFFSPTNNHSATTCDFLFCSQPAMKHNAVQDFEALPVLTAQFQFSAAMHNVDHAPLAASNLHRHDQKRYGETNKAYWSFDNLIAVFMTCKDKEGFLSR